MKTYTEGRTSHCDVCNTKVWVSHTSPAHAIPRCIDCFVELLEPGEKIEPLTEQQKREIKSMLD
jgi:hypothetical protein